MRIRDLLNVKRVVKMKFWERGVRASKKSSPISTLKYLSGGQVKACREKDEANYFRLLEYHSKGDLW